MDIQRLSFPQILQRHEVLDRANATGTLTEALLDAAVNGVVEDPGDGPFESIGYDWISRNVESFAAVVGDKLAFMRRHLDNRYFAGLVILNHELFRLLPEAERPGYLRDSIMRHGARNHGWVPTALGLGVPREQLAWITLAKLEEVDKEQLRYANFLDDFVRHGHGRIEGNWLSPDSEWGVLSDEQFVAAMTICARKSPREVLDAHTRIGKRAKPVLFAAIIRDAAEQVDVVGDPAPFAHLSLDDRIAFARRLKPLTDGWQHAGAPTMRFLAELLIEIAQVASMASAKALFQELKPVLETGHAPTLYRAVLSAKRVETPERQARSDAKGVLDKIQDWLEDVLLPKQGYVLGTVEEGVRTDAGRRGQSQMQVWIDPRVYVPSRDAHRYHPRVGDRVLFQPNRARHLARNVWATTFIPCDPARDY